MKGREEKSNEGIYCSRGDGEEMGVKKEERIREEKKEKKKSREEKAECMMAC